MSMIFTYDGTNSSCSLLTTAGTCAEILYYLKEVLKQAGWTVVKSSDGTTVNSSGDRITSVGTGTNGMSNLSAWYVIQQPTTVGGTKRQFMFQMGSAFKYNASATYSWGGLYTGGTATVAPTASDGQTMWSNTQIASNSQYRFSVAADNASPNGFYMFSWLNGNPSAANIFSGFVFEPMLTGTYSSSDVDPYIMYYGSYPSTSVFQTAGITSETLGTAPSGWLKKGSADQGWGLISAMQHTIGAATTVIPANLPVSPFTGRDTIFPIAYARRSALAAPTGFKGIGSTLKWVGNTGRSTTDTLSISSASAKDYIVVGNIALPWNGSTPTA